MDEYLKKYRKNQIWKNRSRTYPSALIIHELYKTKHGTVRVSGHAFPDGAENWDGDARSVERMWPVRAFEPAEELPEEDK